MAGEGTGTWAQMLAPQHRGAVAVLAGGTLMFAIDTYVTASLLPSAVAEIGGQAFYAWPTTLFLLAAVVASSLTSRVLATVPAARAYLVALAVFAAGALVGALAPSMAVFLLGRAVQGAGGGLLAGMGYALIRIALPRTLWTRGSALIAAMWGVALIVGPGLGGLLAAAGQWRWAFGALVVGSLVIGALVPVALHRARSDTSPGPFPLGSVLLVGAAAAVLSVAGLAGDVLVAGAGLLVALALLVGFVVHERRTRAAVLPRATFRRGSPLRWVYGLSAVLVGVSGLEAFVPLVGQQVAGLSPVLAGFLGVALGAGWVAGEMVSASAHRPRWRVLAGPGLLAGGTVLVAVTLVALDGPAATVLWAVGLVAGGLGIGTAWPHLAASAIGGAETGEGAPGDDAPDEGEADKASAAVTTVQMLAVSVGTALGGVGLALGGTDPLASARWLFAVFAVVAVVGALAARPAARGVPTRA
ncbi:MFS transporter [Actinomycetospora cinnamomea]|uniref:Putative MFS family arabinose efflux permease n=1 Tax=Actinomycetospora cinnamomea TaxID=663609 RepID=A0A2U1E9S4_9PSEU|nr:MFS transporter [Actinomycetospora cinnamomea]PVY96704.1 putative MFS family arabinose efflux permease [Actinomycetospora cinnamomea]